jgi:hypothetical protein
MPNVWYALAAASGLGLLMVVHLWDGAVLRKRCEIAPVLTGDGDESGEALARMEEGYVQEGSDRGGARARMDARMEEGYVQEGAVDCLRIAYGRACKEALPSSDRGVKQLYLRCHVHIENTHLLIINGLPAGDLQSVVYNMESGLLIGEVLVGPFDVHVVSWRAVSKAVGNACGVQGKFRRRRICFSYQPCGGAVEVELVKVKARLLACCLRADMMLT